MLRSHSTIDARVIVRRRPIKKLNGQVTFDGEDYYITVSSLIDSQAQAETLMHEWAHVLAIEEGYNHGETWGAMYSRVYAFCEEHHQPGEE
jgi:hypothetical protein